MSVGFPGKWRTLQVNYCPCAVVHGPHGKQGELFYILDSCRVSESVRRGRIRNKPHLTRDITCAKPQNNLLKKRKEKKTQCVKTKSDVCERCCAAG